MADKRRLKRLETLILETVAPLVAHGLSDPRLGMVTVTRVHLAPDMSIAHVNWSTLGGASEESKAQHALEHARGRIQAAVAAALQTRTTPRLEFHYDESLARAQRVTEVLDQIAKERAEREGTPPPEAAPEAPPEDAGDA
ncbi:MAG TPA: 30S ribosome-binding factor RbfA [Planctomycetota bacterium]|nr:30S ribosome-binding factor RbfA [Planctomycetota bacterium]